MKLLNYTKLLTGMAVIASLFTACDKVKTVTPLGDAGQTIVKLMDGGTPGSKSYAIDFVPTPITLIGADIRRDVATNADLNKTMTVVIKDDTAALRAYNPALIYLPANFYTIDASTPKVGGKGGTFSVVLQPGQFAKEIKITIPDATLLDPSSKYGLAFTIQTADAGGVITKNKTVIVEIGAKNIYDGKYSLNFCNYHPVGNPNYTCDATEVHLVTTGGNAVKMFWPDAGGFYIPITYNGSVSYFGAQSLGLTINPATNTVVAQNVDPGAGTFYTMNPNFNSYYDPASKTFYLKFGYSYVGGQFTTGTSREWTLTLKYLGPR